MSETGKKRSKINFELLEKEEKKFNKWAKKLPKVKHKNLGNSNIWLKFTYTGIGIRVDVGRNDVPNLDKDITDYDSW
jgi:hypothetical protein